MLTLEPAVELSPWRQVVRAARIVSPTAFRLGDRLVEIRRPGTSADQRAANLVDRLQLELYDHCYSRPLASARILPHGRPDRDLVKRLSRANNSRARWDGGWRIEATQPAEKFVVRKNGMARLVSPGEFALSDPYRWPPANGGQVSVYQRRGSRRLQRAFYFAFGETPADLGDDFDLLRLYWNVKLSGAADLMRQLTSILNRFHIPFRFKCLTIPDHYDRVDTAVLFLQRRYYPITSELLGDLWPQLEPLLDHETPLFTKRLAHGLGLAENPPGGGSFGKSRCRFLAQGIWQAYLQCVDTDAARENCIAQCFEAEGLSPERPHLNAGSIDAYAPLIHSYHSAQRAARRDQPYLETAVDIGARLCRDAVWAADQCAWFGDQIETGRNQARVVHGAMGADLYAGSAGIALFLAELHAVTGERAFAVTARAGARHALGHARDSARARGTGFYVGSSGSAYAAVRVGELLQDSDLIEPGLAVIRARAPAALESTKSDVLSGWAGIAPALLQLSRRHADDRFLSLATRLGELLLGSAPDHDSEPGTPLLTGFSHGAAGMAWCLCELFAATADARFKDGAQRFLAYERRFYNHKRRNWEDLRTGFPEPSAGPRYAIAWCNGAPGIALSRLRAFEILGDARCRREAVRALARTARTLQSGLRRASSSDFSLCHGLAGLGEVLLYADRALGRNDYHVLLRQLADLGIANHAADGNWPCGVREGQNPGLLLGMAGIGHFYLRLHDPAALPSALLPATL